MADAIFADPRLAAIYDDIDGDRSDLDHYEAIVDEFGARRVLDVGCGTGTFARRLAARGLTVIAVDPASASLDVARAKPGAQRVTWLVGDATTLPPTAVDAVTMTANVAQVFVHDQDWSATLGGVARRPPRRWSPRVRNARSILPRLGGVDSRRVLLRHRDGCRSCRELGGAHRGGAATRVVSSHIPVP